MSRSHTRRPLPQPGGPVFITDGGLETTLIFHERIELPQFNASTLLRTAAGQAILLSYYRRYADVARQHQCGLILETPTWRGSPDWLAKLGINRVEFAEINHIGIALMNQLRAEYDLVIPQILVAGCVGPCGDGYWPVQGVTVDAAEAYHREQIALYADAEVDFVSAMTINTIAEAMGIVRAARAHAMNVTVSFTVETDGRLPTGHTLREAIETVDAATGGPAYYMINCAHPAHFEPVLRRGGAWTKRILALRANASRLSHAELDEAVTLDAGDPAELARSYAELKDLMPQLTVFGGCCGTDHRHIGSICTAVTAPQPKTRAVA
ncbi:MAG TPA: homocysteine S-methyltransferase family protein [Opitutaceae bacterium]|nr:homocysteine S-methyltransferase family protein [Opitutaceae bacterium]HRJ47686.1 homocysteine S-methyltransferase family protein [Opitutaceae bacterium]